MSDIPIDIQLRLRPSCRLYVLKYFYERPNQAIHLQEIIEALSEWSSGNIKTATQTLTNNKVLTRIGHGVYQLETIERNLGNQLKSSQHKSNPPDVTNVTSEYIDSVNSQVLHYFLDRPKDIIHLGQLREFLPCALGNIYVALCNLCKEGLLKRVSRGAYILGDYTSLDNTTPVNVRKQHQVERIELTVVTKIQALKQLISTTTGFPINEITITTKVQH